MKRTLTVAILFVFIGYILVFVSSINFLKINRIPHVKSPLAYFRNFAGIGALFTREVTLQNRSTSYRYYYNNHWQKWRNLEQPLFNDYVEHAKFASLKHNRLDIHLAQDLYFKGYKRSPNALSQTNHYQVFINHLLKFHQPAKQPDSIEIKYWQSSKGGTKINLLTTKNSYEKD